MRKLASSFVLAVAFGCAGVLTARAQPPAGAASAEPAGQPGGAQPNAPLDLAPELGALLKKHDVPALGVYVLKGGRVVASGVAGVRARREKGDGAPVQIDDRWHVGSISKSVTATLCARLVEKGVLRWDQTLGETFPAFKDRMHERFRSVTLHELLMHRGGVEGGAPPVLWLSLMSWEGSMVDAREYVLQTLTALPPAQEPGVVAGVKPVYSNLGYVIAGHMAEQATGRAWEDLVREEVFEPLHLTSAGFGAPGTRGTLDQPRGHREDGKPVPPGAGSDNPPAIGPAGTLHMSLADLAAYAQAHLEGDRGAGTLLKPESWKVLHTPPAGGDYACGLVTRPTPWSKAPAIWHNGSNTRWYAQMWIVPSEDLVVVGVCNQLKAGVAASDAACDLAARRVLGLGEAGPPAPAHAEK